MAFCSSCGTKLADSVKFCPVCGKKVSAPSAPAQAFISIPEVEPAPKSEPEPEAILEPEVIPTPEAKNAMPSAPVQPPVSEAQKPKHRASNRVLILIFGSAVLVLLLVIAVFIAIYVFSDSGVASSPVVENGVIEPSATVPSEGAAVDSEAIVSATDVPTLDEEPAVVVDPNLGVYVATGAKMWGLKINISDYLEGGCTIELLSDGICSVEIDGVVTSGTWTLDGDTFHIEGGDVACDGTLSDGVMILKNVMDMGITLTLDKQDG